MTTWVMIVLADQPIDKARHINDILAGAVPSWFLKDFDPNDRGGRGEASFTHDLKEAKRFDSAASVFECWRTQSTVLPIRPDGKPNRPLTAYTILPHEL